MKEKKICQSCSQQSDCQQIYKQMGNLKGPCIALSVFLVFLLPIGAFIISLAVLQRTFAHLIQSPAVATLTSVILAAATAFLVILVVRRIMKKK
jgi:hypothetical protein